jgi:hypothetical protein
VADAQIELEIGRGPRPGEYGVQVLRAASGGGAQSAFTLDVEALLDESRRVENNVLLSAVPSRGPVVPELEQPLRQVGSELFAKLFSGPIGTAYRASLTLARADHEDLRVVLRLTAPELAMMPWEALYDDERQAYVCRTESLVRHIDAPYTPERLPVRPPLRILGLVASPRDLPRLDVDAEIQHLEDALAVPISARQVVVEWLAQASWSAVHERLLHGQWHVLHFIGHGHYDRETNEGSIALVRADRRADDLQHWVRASELADLLERAQPTPRLVVLNSCASGQSGRDDLFSGTVATLVHRGIGAVVAMQFSVSDIAAVAFPRGFYTALARGRSVDEAVGDGRMEILGEGTETLEWVTPVLYVCSEATDLFALSEPLPDNDTAQPTPAPAHLLAPQVHQTGTPTPSASQNANPSSAAKAITPPQEQPAPTSGVSRH